MRSVSADDVLITLDEQVVHARLRDKRRYGNLERVGSAKFEIPTDSLILESLSDGVFKYVKAAQRHAEYILANARQLFVEPSLGAFGFYNDNLTGYRAFEVVHAGIKSVWTIDDLSDHVAFSKQWVLDTVPGVESTRDSYTRDVFRLAYYRDNPNDSLFVEAYNLARKQLIADKLSNLVSVRNTLDVTYALNNGYKQHLFAGEWVGFGPVASLLLQSDAIAAAKPTSADINQARLSLVAQRAEQARVNSQSSKQISVQNFSKYWESIKSRIAGLVDRQEVLESFASVPLNPAGTRSSRTWGIEVETVQAHLTSRPRGWDQRGDGSLESMSGSSCTYDYCDCGCDQCDDGVHDDCYSDDSSECAEFVSPILNHFNSDGLLQLCNDIGNAPCNTSPGIHVHVGASDLTPTDVARLVRLYSLISPFLNVLSYREVFGYCKDISSGNIAHWLSYARAEKRGTTVSVSNAVSHQPDDRYRDINLQAFNQHGTIEFRLMGPKYDYAHLVRWAWLCRELVNISKLDLPDSMWRDVRSMADILNIVYQYGSETNDTVMSPLAIDRLTVEFDDEASND